jgi:protein-disulfide isomerase-like protein with CxxC motif
MAAFITRVELHDSTSADYETLHQAMAAQGFTRVISGDDGVSYTLPTGEYFGQSETGTNEVTNLAGFAASMTGKAFALLVTEFERISWRGLKPVS